jgi:hypothetical protein
MLRLLGHAHKAMGEIILIGRGLFPRFRNNSLPHLHNWSLLFASCQQANSTSSTIAAPLATDTLMLAESEGKGPQAAVGVVGVE